MKCNLYNNAFYIGNNENPYLVLIQAKDENIKSCEIYNGTRFINENAFHDCKKITKISIPSTVIRIGAFAFSGCCVLKKLQYLIVVQKLVVIYLDIVII
ncbi:MAG: leucine-rich repeat protein [Bacilli bacterium]